MIWRGATVLLAAFGTVVAVATPSSADTTIPYTYVDNRIVVECRLDGQGPFTMSEGLIRFQSTGGYDSPSASK
jgi:hypothetical protein